MSQQGERAAVEDDWWGRLYDGAARDTGGGETDDSLDDRFDLVSDVVSNAVSGGAADAEPDADAAPGAAAPDAAPVAGADAAPGGAADRPAPGRAPWEPPEAGEPAPGSASAGPPRPRTFAAPSFPAAPARPAPARPAPTGPALPPDAPPSAVVAPAAPAPPAVPPPAPSPPVAPPAAPPAPPVPPAAPPSADASPPLPRRPVVDRTVDTIVAVTEQAQAEARDRAREAGRTPASALAARPEIGHVGDRPPTYDPEPTALPATVPQELDGLVAADTVLDGARYGTCTLRAASVRGDSARFRGQPRRDVLLTARFGADRDALVLVAVATGARAAEQAHLAAADACRWIAGAVGRSHLRLSEDIRAGRRDDLRSGLHRLTDRGYGRLRARAAELGLEPGRYTAGLRCLLLSADPDCRTRIFFGVGPGGLFRLRDGLWQDLEPESPERPPAIGGDSEHIGGDGSGRDGGSGGSGGWDGDGGEGRDGGSEGNGGSEGHGVGRAEPFRFRASVARPGDTLLLCSPGLAAPLRGEPALARELAGRWAGGEAPGLAAFLLDTQLRVKGYSDDRTSIAVWEA